MARQSPNVLVVIQTMEFQTRFGESIDNLKDAGGSRTHFLLLCRQPPDRLAPAPKVSFSVLFDLFSLTFPRRALFFRAAARVGRWPPRMSPPGIEPGLRPSQSRVRIQHTPGTYLFSTAFYQRQALQYLTRESNPVLRFRRPPCRPSHSQGIKQKSRRRDSHPHDPVYRTSAFLCRATSAVHQSLPENLLQSCTHPGGATTERFRAQPELG